MIFALAGASGTGKSTLAAEVAKELDIQYAPVSISELGKKVGFNTVGDLTLKDRLDLQSQLFVAYRDFLLDLDGHVVIDRSPLDLAAYLMAEFNMHSHGSMTPKELELVQKYAKACQNLAARTITHLYVVSPLPSYTEVETRPKENRAYQEHIHQLVCGLAYTAPASLSHSVILASDLKTRVSLATERFKDCIAQFDEIRAGKTRLH